METNVNSGSGASRTVGRDGLAGNRVPALKEMSLHRTEVSETRGLVARRVGVAIIEVLS